MKTLWNKKILGNGELNPGPPRAVPDRTWQAEILATKLLPILVILNIK